jgi:hypothetical protein
VGIFQGRLTVQMVGAGAEDRNVFRVELDLAEAERFIADARAAMRNIDTAQICPACAQPLTEVGDIGIGDYEGRWTAQATRYRCASGHMTFVTDAAAIDEAEIAAADSV